MDQSRAHQRLALLLAGCSARWRRALAERATEAPLDALSRAGAPATLLGKARRALTDEVHGVLHRLTSDEWRWLVPGDQGYPSHLYAMSDPPLGLFASGTVPEATMVAVVGSRRATAYGLQVARLLGRELGRAGLVVVSGMARGIDAEAHRGALDEGAPTVAVWGTGPDRIYPPEHGQLAQAIARGGALLTEYPPGTPARRHNFPARNRIIAGMAAVVVVVEAGVRSGALITARLALDEGREVLAVPGSIFSELSLGPHALLRLGARPLITVRDVLDALDISGQVVAAMPQPILVQGDRMSELLGVLQRGEALSADDLAMRRGADIKDVLVELLELELQGSIERLADGRFARRWGP